MTKLAKARLTADALNRMVRTFLVVVFADVFLELWPILNDALQGTDPVPWSDLQKMAIRVALTSAGSFVMRRVLDPSRVPTPLPPSDAGPPTSESMTNTEDRP